MINNLTKQKLISLIAESLLKENPNAEEKPPAGKSEPRRRVSRKKRLPAEGGESVPPSETTEVPATDDTQKPVAAQAASDEEKAGKIINYMHDLYYKRYLPSRNKQVKDYFAKRLETLYGRLPADYKEYGQEYIDGLESTEEEEKSNTEADSDNTEINKPVPVRKTKPTKKLGGTYFFKKYRKQGIDKQFANLFGGTDRKAFNRFYKKLEAKGLLYKLGRRRKDYQFGPNHFMAYESYLDTLKDEKSSDSSKSSQKKKAPGRSDDSTGKGAGASKSTRDSKDTRTGGGLKRQGLGTGRLRSRRRGGNITLRERGFQSYTLPRSDYEFIITSIIKEPFITREQIKAELVANNISTTHLNVSVVDEKIKKAMKKYRTKAIKAQDP